MDKHICRAKWESSSPWRKSKNGEWVYGYYVKANDEYGGGVTHAIISTDCRYRGAAEYDYWEWYEIDSDTVCRCTGLQDSNKTPIFEKDIVEFSAYSRKDRYLIWWSNEMSMLTTVPLDGIEFNGWDYWNGKYPQFEYDSFCFMMQDPYGDFSEVKVVGNIVDNPELLEVQK
jgi:uncharacterized phage protein (TIGR01671 family)